ncbi:MAG: pyridine nucleotide-disulfide oxidoreductase, partial [Bacteroidales bacterium]|nr:pyridine nucleotide-disulfide oxidoreductase [Bacteroidales bacterium]
MLRLCNILLLLILISAGCKQEVFVECESFEDRGGWVVDPQFVEQMGSPYLMAHGMGEPVEKAATTIQIQSSGSYHVWARTKDWAPGNWDAPGRFNIWLDGQQLSKTMGNYKGWGWNYAGKVNVKGGLAVLELEDLTGFNARCDAIYICNRYR